MILSKGQHAGEDIANFFSSLKKYGIINKIQRITLDNASVNTNFVEELEFKLLAEGISFSSINRHFRCFAHIINLAVQDVLVHLKFENSSDDTDGNNQDDCSSDDDDDNDNGDDNIEDNDDNNHNKDSNDNIDNDNGDKHNDEDDDIDDNLSINGDDEHILQDAPLVKLRKLCKARKYSKKLRKEFEQLCHGFGEHYTSLPLDISTRWNTTYSIITIALEMRKTLSAFTLNHKRLKCL